MPIGLLFWVIMILWLLFGFWSFRSGVVEPHYLIGSSLMLFVLFFILGWHAFGFIVQGQ